MSRSHCLLVSTALLLLLAGAAPDALEAARSDFRKSDRELNRVYKEVCQEIGAARTAWLIEMQRRWIGYRDGMAAADLPEGKDPKIHPQYWERAAAFTRERTEFLLAYSGKDVEAGIAGKYTDGFGGELELTEVAGDIVFKVDVVRGPTSHLGSLQGKAQRSGDKATFLEKLVAGETRQPSKISLTLFDGHVVRVDGENTEPHHGARAYFDGTYYKRRAGGKM